MNNEVILDEISVDDLQLKLVRDDIFPFIGGGSKARKAVAYEKFLRENGRINKITVTIDNDGNMKLFAELEKTTARQKERIEKAKEQKAEDKKDKVKNPYEKGSKPEVKRTTIEASSET